MLPGARSMVGVTAMTLWDRLAAIETRFEELTKEMGQPEVAGNYEQLQALAGAEALG